MLKFKLPAKYFTPLCPLNYKMIAKNARDVGWVWKSRTIHRHWGHLWGGSIQHGNLRHQALETCLKIIRITEACLLFLFATPMKVDEVEYQIKPSDPTHTFIPVSKVSIHFFPVKSGRCQEFSYRVLLSSGTVLTWRIWHYMKSLQVSLPLILKF